jgi:hypothetical protein
MSRKIVEMINRGLLPDELNFTEKPPQEPIDLEKLRYNTFYKSPEFWLNKFENPNAFLNMSGSNQIIDMFIANSKTPLEEILMRQEGIDGLAQFQQTTDDKDDDLR